jgi:hypothetical protein
VYSYTKPSISPLQIKIDEYETKKGDYEWKNETWLV